MLGIVIGGLGSGKSLFLTILAKYSDKDVVANYELKNIKYTKFNIKKFINGEYSSCVVLIDEVYQYIDSRDSQTSLNKLFSYILFQSRKKGLEIYICAQLFSTIDIRYRSLSDLIINCEKGKKGFVYEVFKPSDINNYRKSFLPHSKAKKFFEYYDTNEVIFDTKNDIREKFMSNKERITFAKNEGKKLLKKYESEFRKNNPDKKRVNKITRSYVKMYCLENDISDSLVSVLYDWCSANFYMIVN